MKNIITIKEKLKVSLWRSAYELYACKGVPNREELLAVAESVIMDSMALRADVELCKSMTAEAHSYIDEIMLTINRMKIEHAVKSVMAENTVDFVMDGKGIRYAVKCGVKWPEVTLDAGNGVSVVLQLNYRRIQEQAPALEETAEVFSHLVENFGPDLEVTGVLPWVRWNRSKGK